MPAFQGFTHRACEYFPCHSGVRRVFNCLFCYCPLMERECPGPYLVYSDARGAPRKDCSACRLPHEGISPSWRFIQRWLAAPRWSGQARSDIRLRGLVRALRHTIGQANQANPSAET